MLHLKRLLRFVLMGVAAIAVLALAAVAAAAAPLPSNIVDREQVSVSGVSAGGYMAVQMHVAHSATFKKGVGVVAGGPYDCAEGSVVNALGRCMKHYPSIPVNRLAEATRQRAAGGAIDPVAHLGAGRVYLFSGTRDSVVAPGVVSDLETYYRNFVPSAQIVRKQDVPAEHAMVTEDFGNSCATRGEPFINDCDFDLAGALLAHLHGPLQPPAAGALGGRLVEFRQAEFISGHGMADTAWAYVPQGCTRRRPAGCTWRCTAASKAAPTSARTTCATRATTAGPIPTAFVVLYPRSRRSRTCSCSAIARTCACRADGGDAVRRVATGLEEAGIAAATVRAVPPSLEDVFIHLVTRAGQSGAGSRCLEHDVPVIRSDGDRRRARAHDCRRNAGSGRTVAADAGRSHRPSRAEQLPSRRASRPGRWCSGVCGRQRGRLASVARRARRLHPHQPRRRVHAAAATVQSALSGRAEQLPRAARSAVADLHRRPARGAAACRRRRARRGRVRPAGGPPRRQARGDARVLGAGHRHSGRKRRPACARYARRSSARPPQPARSGADSAERRAQRGSAALAPAGHGD